MTWTITTQPDLGANQEGTPRQDSYLSIPVLTRQAEMVVQDLHLSISGCRIRKLVRRYVREGRCDLEFRTWFLAYADPTGETAVRHVMGDQA